MASNSLYIDPVSAFITAYLPILREKVNGLLLTISKNPQSMSSFMFQILSFDESLRRDFNYDGGDFEQGWKGLTWEVLDVWFDRWLEIEKDFALARYHNIMIESQKNEKLDYDSSGPGKTKPTYAASMVTDLLLSVTNVYERLRKFSRKLRFLIDIQLKILDAYHNRLTDSLEVYQAITSTVGRTLHGITKEQQAALEGNGALETLCKVFGSAEHIISTLRDWSNTIVGAPYILLLT